MHTPADHRIAANSAWLRPLLAMIGITCAVLGVLIGWESNPGRMSPVSSLCLTIVGLALVMVGVRGAWRWKPGAVGALASVVISIAAVALLGHAFRLPGTYGWGLLTRMQMGTAAGLCLAGIGLFMIAWRIGLEPGELAPRWAPAALGLAVLTGSLVLYFALEGRQDQEIAQTVRAGAEGASNQIAVRMESRFQGLGRRALEWEFSGAPTQAAWEANAASYIHDLPDMVALEWIDGTHHVRWVAPETGNGTNLKDSTLDERRKAALEEADREREPVITRTISLADGELGFVVYVPIVVNGQPDGFLAAVLKAQACLERYLPPAVADGEAISVSEGGEVFYTRGADAPPMREEWVVPEKIELRGVTWNLRMWPTPALAARLASPLPLVVLCAGTLGALLLGAVSYYAQRSSRQATETARANAALQNALDQVKTLEGLLPICCYCKRVRDDTGYWSQIDTYLRKHTNASLTHGYCPECAAKFYEECGLDVPEKVKAEIAAGNYE